jgi:hypothetical protein
MKQLSYEKPRLIILTERTIGQVTIQGTCSWGSTPGGPTSKNICDFGYYAAGGPESGCVSGLAPGQQCGTGSGI